MQVYRGLDIGTAKPSPADRARVPHHLIDICDLTESFDAAQFARLAHRAVAEIQSRGRVPVLCGGTGLYFKAFLEGLGEAPSADAKFAPNSKPCRWKICWPNCANATRRLTKKLIKKIRAASSAPWK